jgi:hypothetical protein
MPQFVCRAQSSTYLFRAPGNDWGSPLGDVIAGRTRTQMEIMEMSFSRIALIVAILAVPCTANAGWGSFGSNGGSFGGSHGSRGSFGGSFGGSHGSHGSNGGCFGGLFSGSHGSCGSHGGCQTCCQPACGCEAKSCGCEEKKSDCGCSNCGGEVKSSGCGCGASTEASSDAKVEPAPAAPSTKEEQKAAESNEKK